MNCPKCGLELKEDEKVCPICQTNREGIAETNANNKYEDYKETEKLNKEYGFNKLLIFSILEIFCCNQIFGIIAIIFLFLKLKPAIADKNFEEMNKWKRAIKVVLIVGVIIGLLIAGLQIIVELLPVIEEMSQTLV